MSPSLEQKLAALEAELMLQTGCRAEEIAGVYNRPIAKPVCNARMGETLRARFAAEGERDALRAQNTALVSIIENGIEMLSGDNSAIEDIVLKNVWLNAAEAAIAAAKGEK